MFETSQTAVAAIASNVVSVGAVFGAVIGVVLAITLGPRFFKMGLKWLKGR